VATVFFLTVVTVALLLDSFIKSTVESVGPKMTRTAFTLDQVDIRLLQGSGRLTGLLIGNPTNYSSTFAMKMDEALLDIHAGTFLDEKLVVESIKIAGPEITFEGSRTENNLKAIALNIGEFVGTWEERERLDRKLQVNHFLLSDAKVHLRLELFGKREITLKAPTIELHDLGMGPEGITSAELSELVIQQISDTVGGMIVTALAELGRESRRETP